MNRPPSNRTPVLLWIVLIGLSLPATARAVAPRVSSLLPTGAQRGTEVEVRFAGQRLQDVREIVFYSPGLSLVKMNEPKADSLTAILRIDPECRLGEHPIRLRTATGVSEVRTFWVGALTNLAELEPNSEPRQAQRIPLNCTVLGNIPSEDVDHFLVKAQKGTRVSAEIEAMRLGRGAFDPYLCIQNRQGQVLAAAEDSALLQQDAVVSLIAPETGEYVIQVRETSYGGRDDFFYRLHVGSFPRPMAVYPVGGRAGTTVAARFLGDAAGEFEQSIRLPAAAQDKFGVFAKQPARENPDDGSESSLLSAPSPNWVRVTAHPTALESEPNDTREQAGSNPSSPEIPILFNGMVSQHGDHDWFRFRAKKGQALQVSVFARRLRSPLDSAIQIVNAQGAAVAENDDGAGPDSALTFKPEADGEYALLVRDHLKRGGPAFVYCVEVAPVEPSLTLKIPEVARNDTQSRQYIAVPRGNRFATLISARRTGFSGELRFRVEDLPAGLRLEARKLPDKVDQFPLVFEASADAPLAGNLLDLTASGGGVTGRYRNDIELVQGPNNTFYFSTRVDKLFITVTEAAPFQIRIVEPKVPLLQGGSMDLKVAVERQPGFAEPITLKLVWNPPGVTSQPDVVIGKDASTGVFVLNAKGDSELRSWPIALLASAKVDGGDLFVSSQLSNLELGPPFLSAKIQTTACSPGGTTNLTVKLDPLTPFTGRATLKLMGLSDKVAAPEREVTQDDKEVSFPITVDPTCPTGSQRNLFCTVSVKKDGELLTHNAGQGGVLRIVPLKKPGLRAAGPKKVASNP